jgi:hypothetical protein
MDYSQRLSERFCVLQRDLECKYIGRFSFRADLNYYTTIKKLRVSLSVRIYLAPRHLIRFFQKNVLCFKFVHYNFCFKSLGGSVNIALGYRLDDRGSRVRFPEGMGIFLFTTASRTALGPTQPPI